MCILCRLFDVFLSCLHVFEYFFFFNSFQGGHLNRKLQFLAWLFLFEVEFSQFLQQWVSEPKQGAASSARQTSCIHLNEGAVCLRRRSGGVLLCRPYIPVSFSKVSFTVSAHLCVAVLLLSRAQHYTSCPFPQASNWPT